MKIEMGESLMQSWLKHVKGCKITQLNWKCSETWQSYHKDEISMIIEKIKVHYPTIFKQNKAEQLISQAELDILGINTDITPNKFYAIDIAFHEFGLNYGSKEETVDRVTKKIFRSALVLYSQFNLKSGEIIFASPKVNPAIYELLQNRFIKINNFMNNLGFNFHFCLLANERFYYEIFSQTCAKSTEIADTSELFMRAFQLSKLCENFESKKVDKTETIRKIHRIAPIQKKGLLAKQEIIHLFEKNNIFISNDFTKASKNSTQNKYWANPNISNLNKDWWLVLDDCIKKELHCFLIPTNSISIEQIKTRSDKPYQIDLQINYNDKMFTDSRSGIEFLKWHKKTLQYSKINSI